MTIWNKLGKAINFVPKKIDVKIEEEIADKTGVAVLAALKQLDGSLPILTTLLAGLTPREFGRRRRCRLRAEFRFQRAVRLRWRLPHGPTG